jgi:glycosyltransferase involved in cell wall biosynthesis
MRILIDIQGCQTESRFRGIGRYSMALTKEIARQGGTHDIWLLLNKNIPGSIDSLTEEFSNLIPRNQIVTFQTPMPIAIDANNFWRVRAAEIIRESFIASFKPDVVYVTSLFEGWNENAVTSIGLVETTGKAATTLYDLIPFLNQESYLFNPQIKDFYFRKINSLKKADLLMSISEYSRQECVDSIGVQPEHIVNVSTAADSIFRKINVSDQEAQSLLRQYGIAGPFIMYTGGFDLRKNILRLFEAYSLLPEDIRNSHQLLMAGRTTDATQLWLKTQVRKLGIEGNVIVTGYIPDDDLARLYNICALFVFPSLHEGFGLPALEAMACGAPAIGSNTTSIPEVIGYPNALFDPTNSKSIAEKMVEVLSDVGLNTFLREHGIRQAKKFSWETSARRVLEAFETMTLTSPANQKVFRPVRKESYNTLISSIADIPQTTVKTTNQDLMDTAECIWKNERTMDRAIRACNLGSNLQWRVEGTFHDNYSLSILTRETARALAKLGHKVSLWSSNAPGFYLPTPETLSEYFSANPDLAQMYNLANQTEITDVDIVSRNIYPPYVDDMMGRVNLLHHYAWEETGFPIEWANNFNEKLQGITCLSTHVEKILIDHGVNVPLSTSGSGVDHWERISSDPNFKIQARDFRFLHVSSCFPRKAVDILLIAYGQVFNSSDNVSLVIKTFKNPHNQIYEWLAEQKKRRSDFPHVLIIEDDLADTQLKSLYEQCHVFVGPSRAEGFGLPFAEAILSGLPVITTRWGGQLDFCNEETAWLVNYKFERANTHFNLFDSAWVEPNVKDLADKMYELYTISPEMRQARPNAGRQLLLERFRWVDVAERLVQSARAWATMPAEPNPKIGWISTWNTKCGIASYSEHLLRYMPARVNVLAAHTNLLITGDNSQFVTRSWSQDVYADKKDDLGELNSIIEEKGLDTLVVQFNYGFFDFTNLNNFLTKHLDAGKVIIVVFHSTTDPAPEHGKRLSMLLPALKRCQRLLVHSINDLNRLKDIGLVDNVTLFPHGVLDYSPSPRTSNKEKIIASYGFFLPPKGLLELIDALSLMRESGKKVKLQMINSEYPIPISAELINIARKRIDQLKLSKHVELVTEYLSDQESLDLISKADLIVFPYQQTGESSSAAVRYGLATGRPVAVTPLSIFDDVASAVLKLPGFSPAHIAEGVTEILRDLEKNTDNIRQTQENANRWRKSHFYSQLSYRFYGMVQALHRKRLSSLKVH